MRYFCSAPPGKHFADKTLLGTRALILVAKGIATSSKCIASSNKCLTSSNKKLLVTKGLTTRSKGIATSSKDAQSSHHTRITAGHVYKDQQELLTSNRCKEGSLAVVTQGLREKVVTRSY